MDPAGGAAPELRYRLALHALAMHVHPTFFDLATPLSGRSKRGAQNSLTRIFYD